jgi:hypothetical protein
LIAEKRLAVQNKDRELAKISNARADAASGAIVKRRAILSGARIFHMSNILGEMRDRAAVIK